MGDKFRFAIDRGGTFTGSTIAKTGPLLFGLPVRARLHFLSLMKTFFPCVRKNIDTNQ